MSIDLHTHSQVSDGTLSIRDLIDRASHNGCTILSITDHDDLGSVIEAREYAQEKQIRYIPGVEISATWRHFTVHIVGLGVDANHRGLQSGLESLRLGRKNRILGIIASLNEAGIPVSFDQLKAYASNLEIITRAHIARLLVDQGYADSMSSVFKNYLVRGKPGFIAHQWALLDQVILWIKSAGGIAVLAHPARYRMTKPEHDQLIEEFVECEGQALEVISGKQSPHQTQFYAKLANRYGLLASCGSDFHCPDESLTDVGCVATLPNLARPVYKVL